MERWHQVNTPDAIDLIAIDSKPLCIPFLAVPISNSLIETLFPSH